MLVFHQASRAIAVDAKATDHQITPTKKQPGIGAHLPDSVLEQRTHLSEAPPADEPPNRLLCFDRIFRHFGLERGRTKGTVSAAKDGSVWLCCLISKDYEAHNNSAEGERYWFTIYDNQIYDIRQSTGSFVAFACGTPEQIVLIPVDDFCSWTEELPPYTQGKTGWHIHLTVIGKDWEMRRKGYGETPIDVSGFLMR